MLGKRKELPSLLLFSPCLSLSLYSHLKESMRQHGAARMAKSISGQAGSGEAGWNRPAWATGSRLGVLGGLCSSFSFSLILMYAQALKKKKNMPALKKKNTCFSLPLMLSFLPSPSLSKTFLPTHLSLSLHQKEPKGEQVAMKINGGHGDRHGRAVGQGRGMGGEWHGALLTRVCVPPCAA